MSKKGDCLNYYIGIISAVLQLHKGNSIKNPVFGTTSGSQSILFNLSLKKKKLYNFYKNCKAKITLRVIL